MLRSSGACGGVQKLGQNKPPILLSPTGEGSIKHLFYVSFNYTTYGIFQTLGAVAIIALYRSGNRVLSHDIPIASHM